jgi:hypothetical protein
MITTMAFIVKGKGSQWEIRESHSTPKGPRSKTLATFTQLDDAVIARATERAGNALDRKSLEQAARRVGAPVSAPASERTARELLAAINSGNRPSPGLARLLADTLVQTTSKFSDAAQAAAAWIGVPDQERAETLIDLLLLADALPVANREPQSSFPRIPAALT